MQFLPLFDSFFVFLWFFAFLSFFVLVFAGGVIHAFFSFDSKPAAQSAAQPAAEQAAQLAPQSAAQPAAQRAAQPAAQPAAQLQDDSCNFRNAPGTLRSSVIWSTFFFFRFFILSEAR